MRDPIKPKYLLDMLLLLLLYINSVYTTYRFSYDRLRRIAYATEYRNKMWVFEEKLPYMRTGLFHFLILGYLINFVERHDSSVYNNAVNLIRCIYRIVNL